MQIKSFGECIEFNSSKNLIDASSFRQIPDTQEVYLDKESNLSLIIEILEYVDECKNEYDAVRWVECPIEMHILK